MENDLVKKFDILREILLFFPKSHTVLQLGDTGACTNSGNI